MEIKSRICSWIRKSYGSVCLSNFDCFSLRTHALRSAVAIEKISSGTAAVPKATAKRKTLITLEGG